MRCLQICSVWMNPTISIRINDSTITFPITRKVPLFCNSLGMHEEIKGNEIVADSVFLHATTSSPQAWGLGSLCDSSNLLVCELVGMVNAWKICSNLDENDKYKNHLLSMLHFNCDKGPPMPNCVFAFLQQPWHLCQKR